MMKASAFVAKLKDIATNYKTLYVMGCFGAPLNASNKQRYCNNYDYNRQPSRTAMIKAASADTFGFDCVCLVKGVLWGWSGDKNAIYGGADYAINGVPDIGTEAIIEVCNGVSSDFSKIEVGELLWLSGHVGVYIGDGLAVECTPAWKNGVQVTSCNCYKSGYNRRDWAKHGKLPYVTYDVKKDEEPAVKPTPTPTPDKPTKKTFEKGDLVKITGTKYYNGYTIPGWVKAKNWYVQEVEGDRVVINKSEDGYNAICSAVKAADLELVKSAAPSAPASAPETLKVGDRVRMQKGAPVYNSTETFYSFVYNSDLYVREVDGSRIVVSTVPTGPVTGAVDIKYLTKI